jgi:hypothetical protein
MVGKSRENEDLEGKQQNGRFPYGMGGKKCTGNDRMTKRGVNEADGRF